MDVSQDDVKAVADPIPNLSVPTVNGKNLPSIYTFSLNKIIKLKFIKNMISWTHM